MRAAWLLLLLAPGCARTPPLCRDEACLLATLQVDAGSARRPDAGVASQVAYVKAQNTEAGDAFGEAVALSGDGETMAVGAPGEDSRVPTNPFDNRASASGAVSVFVRREETWVAQAYLKSPAPRQGDHFGHRVALSSDGNTLAVSAVDESSDAVGVDQPEVNARAPSSGAVFIFARVGRAWTQAAYLKASNAGAGDLFGASLSLSADGAVLVVGAPGEGSDAAGVDADQLNDRAPGRGALYLFRRGSAGWKQERYLKPREADVWAFGSAAALSADATTLVVQSGADGGVITALGLPGLEEQGSTRATTRFAAVATSGAGDHAASAQLTDTDGRVTVYLRGPPWRVGGVLPSPRGPGFGGALAFSSDGAVLVVGHPGDASRATGAGGDEADTSRPGSGAVRVYVRRGDGYAQLVYLKAFNTGARDAFGTSVALSEDGGTLVVGAPGEASAAVGVGGNPFNESAPNAGAVYTFSLSALP